MQIAVTGANGLIGRHLVDELTKAGHNIYSLKREAPPVPGSAPPLATWNTQTGKINTPGKFEVLIHLAGRNIARHWTKKTKEEIWKSRVDATHALSTQLAEMPAELRPRLILAASAIGIYGDRGDEVLNEDSSVARPNTSFLANVCKAWEDALKPAEDAGIRVAHVRIGVVLAHEGGALAKMTVPTKLCLSGPIGTGMQWISWIWIEDLARLFAQMVEAENPPRVINAVAGAARQHQFIRKIAGALRRPAVVPMPSVMVEVLFGEMGREVLLGSQHVEAKHLPAGFTFKLPNLRDALRAELWR